LPDWIQVLDSGNRRHADYGGIHHAGYLDMPNHRDLRLSETMKIGTKIA
jgi:hypothetical protein